MKANILKNEIAVTHEHCGDRQFLTIDCPNGWDDVKKLTKKVLEFNGLKFTWSCWNSDRNDCKFVHINNAPPASAKILK